MARERQSPKMSRRELGERLNLSESAVAAWESGRNIPDPATLGRIERVLGTADLLQDIVECLVTGEKSQEYIGRWTHVESHATTLLWFEIRLIPGLLQTEEYAYAVLRDEQRVKARVDRQKALAKENPPVLVALIDESVLRRDIGGQAVMTGQLNHLVEMARLEHVIIHVVPMRASVCAQYTGPFILASYDGEREIGYTDDAISGGVLENVDEVARLRRTFEIFRGHALNEEESIRLIQEVARS